MNRWLMSVGVAVVWSGAPSCNGEARAKLLGAAPDAMTSKDRAAVDRYVGRYRHVGGQSERDAVLAAIDEAIADMNVVARGIARGRLRESNLVPTSVVVSHDEHHVAIAFDERQYEAPLDGSSTTVVGLTGDELRYSVSISSAKLQQSFVGPKGTRDNVMALRGEDGLEMRVKVASASLPEPIEYRLTFRRSS